MGGIFNYDGPIWSTLGKLADLVILNLLTLIFCIPIVTIGASLTACHYVALKIRRGEGYVIKNFWKSFKENLVQSTIIWLILAVHAIVLAFATTYTLFNVSGTVGSIVSGILFVIVLFTAFISLWVFPIQSKFINNIGTTFKNAFLMAFKYLFRTLAMLIINLFPLVLALVLSFQWYSLLLLFGFSVPIYLCAMMYDKIFEKIEDMILGRQDGDDAPCQ